MYVQHKIAGEVERNRPKPPPPFRLGEAELRGTEPVEYSMGDRADSFASDDDSPVPSSTNFSPT